MLSPLYLKEDYEYTPLVILNAEEGIFTMKGDVLPNDLSFCDIVINWLREYAKTPNILTNFSFYLRYIDDKGQECIINILKILKEIPHTTIEWHFFEDDEDLEEYGKSLSEKLAFPFKYVPATNYLDFI